MQDREIQSGSPTALSETPLTLRLLGNFEAWVCGRPLPKMRSRKETLLLALLAIHGGREMSRVTVAQTLWPFPEHSTEQANRYLRRSLSELRRALGPQSARLQSPTPRTIALDLSHCDCDIARFDAALRYGDGTDSPNRNTALSLYQGSLLHGFTEEWVIQERAKREQEYRRTLRAVSAEAAASGEYDEAIPYLQRALALDPFAEDAVRDLMVALASVRQYNAAFQRYQELVELLRRDRNVRPDADTTALYLRLREAVRSEAALAAATPSAERARQSRLPSPLTPLIGREEAIREIEVCLGKARLVTLVGMGGVGKTRLSLQVGENAVERRDFEDGVFLAELAALSDAALLPQTIAVALGIREEVGGDLFATLSAYLRSKHLLLILDNCEHLAAACRDLISRLLTASRGLVVLATSRQPMGVLGESVWRVPSLTYPAPEVFAPSPASAKIGVIPSEEMRRYPALQLFVERATAIRNDFILTYENVAAAVQICRQLDGLPLSLELAAARVRLLSVEELAERLDDHLRLLNRGNPTALPRHQTLHALIDWSYELLTEPERRLLIALSIFRGGWTLEAAEQVCGEEAVGGEAQHPSGTTADCRPPTASSPPTPFDVLDTLTSLADKSLVVRAEEGGGRTRFQMRESIRQFAEARLNQAERAQFRARHAACFLILAETAEPRLRSRDQIAWLERLSAEQDNLRAALRWAMQSDSELALRLTAALWRFYVMRGYSAEGRRNLGEAVSMSPLSPERCALRARCRITQCLLADFQAESEPLKVSVEEAIREAQEAGDIWLDIYGHIVLGWIHRQWDISHAEEIIRAAIIRARALGDSWLLAEALSSLTFLLANNGQKEGTGDLIDEGLSHARTSGDHFVTAELISHRGRLAFRERRYRIAQACFEEACGIREALGNRSAAGTAQYYLGMVAYRQKDFTQAATRFRRALAVGWDFGNTRKLAASLEGLAFVADALYDARRATCLLSAAATLRERISHPLPSLLDEAEGGEPLSERLRAALDEETFTLCWSRGARFQPDEAYRYALTEIGSEMSK